MTRAPLHLQRLVRAAMLLPLPAPQVLEETEIRLLLLEQELAATQRLWHPQPNHWTWWLGWVYAGIRLRLLRIVI